MKTFILILLFASSALFAGGPTLDEQHQMNQDRIITNAKATKYPIILHHGLMGFRELLNVEYFHEVPKTLRQNGFDIFTTETALFSGLIQKSEELAEQIDHILKLTGKKKVNIIAHSMGGLDARRVITTLGYEDKVASLSMLGTPNQGTYIADLVTSVANSFKNDSKPPLNLKDYDELMKVVFQMFVSTNQKKWFLDDALQGVADLTQTFIKDTFNPQNPDSPKVYYQSWAGRTYNWFDPNRKDVAGPTLSLTYELLKHNDGENDGMVPTHSAKWGRFRGILEADHIDLHGIPMMNSSKFFDHKKFYQKVALELGEMGF